MMLYNRADMIIHFYFRKYPLNKNWGSSQINICQTRSVSGERALLQSLLCQWVLVVPWCLSPALGLVCSFTVPPASLCSFCCHLWAGTVERTKCWELRLQQFMWLVPSLPCWEIIQVRQGWDGPWDTPPTWQRWCQGSLSNHTEFLWKIRVPHPKNDIPLKASGSFSREQLHLCHAKVSMLWQGTEMCPQCWCGWGWKAGRSPLRLLSLGLPAFPCSQPGPAAAQLFPQQGWGCSGSRTWPGLSPLWGWPPVLVRRGNRLLLLLPLGCFCSGWQWNLSLTPS